jgi:hypothetical protein
MNYRYWLRTDRSLFYGAEQYVISAVKAINAGSANVSADIAYLSRNSRQAFTPFSILFRLLVLAFEHNKPNEERLDIFQFPFIPPFCRRSKLPTTIICFHHSDLINGTLRSRLSELVGLLFLMLHRKNIRIVCVSNYWLSWLKTKGFNNVKVIINPISPSMAQLAHLRLCELGNSCGKPSNIDSLSIAPESQLNIYLGIARRAKGWTRLAPVVRSLFPSANIFVSSPKKLEFISSHDSCFAEKHQVSARYFEHVEDLHLFISNMHICIFASEFREGWNRTFLEASILCNGLTFGLAQGGMKDVAQLAPWITLYDSHENLYKGLKSISCIEELNRQIKFSMYTKNNNLAHTIDCLSISKFVQNWELLSYG